MVDSIVVYMQSIIYQYGAWGVFWATMIEEIIAPIPSPIVPLAAGFFLLPASLSFLEVAFKAILIIAVPVAIGISIGSAIVYALGFFGGKSVIEKSRRLTGVSWQDIEKVEQKITRGGKDAVTLFILRVLPIMPGVAISGFCGIVRYPFKKFIIITGLGALVRAFILGILGWQVGELYEYYAEMISHYEKYIFLIIVALSLLLLGAYLIVKKTKLKKD